MTEKASGVKAESIGGVVRLEHPALFAVVDGHAHISFALSWRGV
jgi:hypothetical protein